MPSSSGRLERVLITGATSGIGKAVARRLLHEGCKVTLAGRDTTKIKDLLDRYPGKAFSLECDYSNIAATKALAGKAYECMGGLDGLVHSAGIIEHSEIATLTEEALLRQFQTNLLGPIRLTQNAMALISGGGAIVFLSSTLADRPIKSSAVYSATKGGMDSFMRAMAVDGASKGIRCNSLVLGMVDTPMIRQVRKGGDLQEITSAERFASLHLLGRLGDVDEVAEATVNLLNTTWMTGARVVLDGGLLLQE